VKVQAVIQPIHAFVSNRKHPHDEDDAMEKFCIREMAPPVADIENLHRELQQLFARTQSRSREAREKTDDTSGGSCLVIKGK
jgi:hypothetical protein